MNHRYLWTADREYKASTTSPATLPIEFRPRSLHRRAVQAIAALAVLLLIFAVAPGLAQVRARLAGASPGWLALGTLLEALSFISYASFAAS